MKQTDNRRQAFRLTEHAFPPYSYVPRMHPHPFSSHLGHSRGIVHEAIRPGEETAARKVHDWAIDLFNHGYYWESHEAWESLWHAFGRNGTQAKFAKGLIKLAAAGVKAREGRPIGVKRHARRAIELFDECSTADVGQFQWCMGLSAAWLRAHCRAIFDHPERFLEASDSDVICVFPFVLLPSYGTVSASSD